MYHLSVLVTLCVSPCHVGHLSCFTWASDNAGPRISGKRSPSSCQSQTRTDYLPLKEPLPVKLSNCLVFLLMWCLSLGEPQQVLGLELLRLTRTIGLQKVEPRTATWTQYQPRRTIIIVSYCSSFRQHKNTTLVGGLGYPIHYILRTGQHLFDRNQWLYYWFTDGFFANGWFVNHASHRPSWLIAVNHHQPLLTLMNRG